MRAARRRGRLAALLVDATLDVVDPPLHLAEPLDEARGDVDALGRSFVDEAVCGEGVEAGVDALLDRRQPRARILLAARLRGPVGDRGRGTDERQDGEQREKALQHRIRVSLGRVDAPEPRRERSGARQPDVIAL